MSGGGPILVTGVYRSGSNLLAHLLDGHPDLSVWSDCVHYFRFIHGRYAPLDNDDVIRALVCDLTDRLETRFGFDPDRGELERRLMASDRTPAGIYDAIMGASFFLRGARRWGEKVSLTWTRAGEFLDFFPHGRVLVILRDPRAVLESWKRETFAPPPLYLDAIFNCLGLLGYLRERGVRRRLHCLRFEDLLRSPGEAMAGVWAFLGEEPPPGDPALLPRPDQDKARTLNTFARANEGRNRVDPGAAEAWVDRIDEDDLALCNALLGPALEEHGYTLRLAHRATGERLDAVFGSAPGYLRNAYLRWRETGQGHEGYPLDPTDPANWRSVNRASEKRG